MKKFSVYLDGNIWQELSLDFEANKKLHPSIWKIFDQQKRGKIDIYCSDINRAEFLRKGNNSFADKHPLDIVEKKIQQCFEKSNKKAKSIIVIGNSTIGNSTIATKEESEKFNELNELLSKTKDDRSNPFDAHHLMTCFVNDTDAFITRDKNILKNWIEIKKLFTKWGKKNFILATPENYLRLHKFVSYSTLLLVLVPIAILFKIFANLSYFDMLLGYGLTGNFLLIYEVIKKISSFEVNDKTKKAIFGIFDLGKTFIPTYYAVFALFTALIIPLANKGITSEIFSSIWLFLLIFAFQIPTFFVAIYLLIKKFNKNHIIILFITMYLLLSAMFGWSSAYVEHDILQLSKIPDLLIATYGTLLLLFVFVKYFENILEIY